MLRRQYSASEKLAILEEIENGEIGANAVGKKHGINTGTLWKWQRRYRVYGYEG